MIGSPRLNKKRILKELAILKNYEFETFRLSSDTAIIENKIREILINDYSATEKPWHNWADISVSVYNTKITVSISPLYIYGRYRKFVRDIPQTKWPCRYCNGYGCRQCSFTGKQYKKSVEDIYGKYLVELCYGTSTRFHGCGREDIDVRMLGSGRPFVLEVLNPQKRVINMLDFQDNDIQVSFAGFTSKEMIEYLKTAQPYKRYSAIFSSEKKMDSDIETIDLSNLTILQKTPTRVLHRRTDILRKRKILDGKISFIDSHKARLDIIVESGFYVKEFISGDNGRTKNSLSEILSNNLRCIQLDVIAVFDKTLFSIFLKRPWKRKKDGISYRDIMGISISEKTDIDKIFSKIDGETENLVREQLFNCCDENCSCCKASDLCIYYLNKQYI